MINVELNRHTRFSVTFSHGIKTVPFYGDRHIVECEIWDDTNTLLYRGRAVMNPLDKFNAAVGARKALAAAIGRRFWPEERREIFKQLDPFFKNFHS